MTFSFQRRYRGPVKLVILDWAGTTMDYGCYAPAVVSSRGYLAFEAVRDGAASHCDLILDLTGDAPLVPAPEKRDGYLRPDPDDPAAVQRALFDLADMVGEYEKPRYVAFDAALCAHSRATLSGCTRGPVVRRVP